MQEENDKLMLAEKTEFYFSKVFFSPGTLYLFQNKLKWQKEYEFFLMTIYKRISYPDYGKEYSVDINLEQISKVGGDPDGKHNDLLVVYLINGKELRFFSQRWDLNKWIELITLQLNKQ